MDTKKKLYLAYEKAFEYWETIGPSSRRSSAPCSIRSIDDAVSGAKDIDAIRQLASDLFPFASLVPPDGSHAARAGMAPVHILVPSAGARMIAPGVVPHVCTRELPADSFREIGKGIFVSSPEFCFLQVADLLERTAPRPMRARGRRGMTGARGDVAGGRRHHLIDETCRLVRIGMEMCGGYASRPGTSVGFVKRAPITSADKLRLYCGLAAGHRGVELARRAARLLVDGSLSPMETALKMLLADPRLYGSMGFRGVLLNCPIEVDAGTLGKTRQRAYRCDLL